MTTRNIVTRVRMMKALWDDDSFVDDNTLTVNVYGWARIYHKMAPWCKGANCSD